MAEPSSFGKPEKYKERAVEPDEICIRETPEMIAHVRPRHRRDLVDHDLAWLLDPGGRCHLYIDPGQRCVEGIGCQRTDRDRGGCIEPIVLNDDDGSRLTGIGTSCSNDADVASPHSAVQPTEMASTKAWSSASYSDCATAQPRLLPRRFAGAGHDQSGRAELNRRGAHLGATGSAPKLFLAAWADAKTVVGLTTEGNLAISGDAGRTWRADLAAVSSGEVLSASRDKAGRLEILVVSDTGVLQSRDDGATLTKLTS